MTYTKSIHSKLSRCVRGAIIIGSLTTVALGGCSSSEEKRRASSLAGGCSLNSDCEKDLICCFERCHIPCKQDRDCEDPLRCVKSEETGIFVCQLEDELRCEIDKDCPGEQQCGVDGECRDGCQEHDDCVGDQICANSNECASAIPRKDMIDPDGNIVPDDPTPGAGGAGTSGNGGTAGTGATSTNGGTGNGGATIEPTAGAGTGGTEPVEMGGAGGMPGGEAGSSGTSTEGGAPSYPPADFEEADDGTEIVNNDDEANAVPFPPTARIFLARSGEGSDDDWFSYRAPDDGHAHILAIRVEQDVALATYLEVFAGEDGTPIADAMSLTQGTTRTFYVTVGADTTTHFRFDSTGLSGSQGFAYLTFTDQVEQDDSEPNNTRETAEEISLGEAISGQVLNPWQAANVDLSQDFFAVELAQGTATFTFSALPTEGRFNVGYSVPNNVTVNSWFTPAAGALQEAKVLTVSVAGTYYFTVRPLNASAIAGSSFNVKPKYYDEQYTFSITQ